MAIAHWLAEFKVLSSERIPGFAESIIGDTHLKNEIFKLLENEKKPENLDPVMHQLFSFYRLDNDLLQRFALEFLPTILYSYFLSFYSADVQRRKCASIEAFLLGIYNIDAATLQEEYLIDRTPSSLYLSLSSVYHHPTHMAVPSQLTKVTLDKLQASPQKVEGHNLVHVESITNRNRLSILSHALMRYNYEISQYSETSYLAVCRLCGLFIKSGLDPEMVVDEGRQTSSRIPVDEMLISHLLQALYFIMYNGLPEEGYLALENLYFRAVYDLLPHSILAIRAVLNMLNVQAGDSDEVSPNQLLSLSKIFSPAVTSKEAITTASYRPHILPEDIEVKDSGREQLALTPTGHLLSGGEDSGVKLKQKSVISKVFHIPLAKKKEEPEKKAEDMFAICGSVSPLQAVSNTHLSAAKRALKNPFKSDQNSTAIANSVAKHDLPIRKDTVSISPYFSQMEASDVVANSAPVKSEKKSKSKGSKLKKKHLKRAPSSTSPKHSLSVSSYLAKDVISERVERARSDIDDEDEDDDDEQNEDECINEVDDAVDYQNKTVANDVVNLPHQGEKRHLLLRHITFAANLEEPPNQRSSHQRVTRSDTERMGEVDENGDKMIPLAATVPLLSRNDSIPRLPVMTGKNVVKEFSGANYVAEMCDDESVDDDDDSCRQQRDAEAHKLLHNS